LQDKIGICCFKFQDHIPKLYIYASLPSIFSIIIKKIKCLVSPNSSHIFQLNTCVGTSAHNRFLVVSGVGFVLFWNGPCSLSTWGASWTLGGQRFASHASTFRQWVPQGAQRTRPELALPQR